MLILFSNSHRKSQSKTNLSDRETITLVIVWCYRLMVLKLSPRDRHFDSLDYSTFTWRFIDFGRPLCIVTGNLGKLSIRLSSSLLSRNTATCVSAFHFPFVRFAPPPDPNRLRFIRRFRRSSSCSCLLALQNLAFRSPLFSANHRIARRNGRRHRIRTFHRGHAPIPIPCRPFQLLPHPRFLDSCCWCCRRTEN